MKIKLNGEELDFADDRGIRSQCMAHAIEMVAMLKGKRLRAEFEKFFADIYFLTVKAGGVLAYHQMAGQEMMPTAHFAEVMTHLRAILGMGEPTLEDTSPTIIVPE